MLYFTDPRESRNAFMPQPVAPQLVTIRRALAGDATQVMAVIEDGRRAIAALGIDQWQHGYPNLHAIEEDIAEHRCYLAEDLNGTVLGTAALCPGRDRDYTAATAEGIAWLTDDSHDPVPYLSVHRCATSAAARRRGVMGLLLDRAKTMARAEGLQSIRMDTHPRNVRMRGFLARQGFVDLGPYHMVSHAEHADAIRIAYELLL